MAALYKNRIIYLDSLRGLAALVVLFFHSFDQFYYKFLNAKTPFEVRFFSTVFNGNDAVSFFYVLSGFVLFYQINSSIEKETFAYKSYLYKRILRIFPLYVFYVVIAFCLQKNFNEKYGIELLFKEILILPNSSKILPPGWSMNIEIIFSLIMPFFYYFIVSNLRASFLFLLIFLTTYSQFSIFGFHFLLGALAAYMVVNKFVLLSSFVKRYYLLMLLSIFLGYFFRNIINLNFSYNYILSDLLSFINYKKSDLAFIVSALGSVSLICFAFCFPKIQKFLMLKFFIYIGRISYSIYLVHWIVIKIVSSYLGDLIIEFKWVYTQSIVFSMIVFVISIILASISYHLVEAPFIKLGQKIPSKKF